MKIDKIKIRRFEKRDERAVNELLQTFHNYTKVNVIDEYMVKILSSFSLQWRNTCALVAEIEENSKNSVVGFGMINLFPVADKNGLVGKIEDVVVNPNYRGFGIAKKICEKLIGFAKKRGAKKVELTSNKNRTAAHKLYEKLGFVNRDTVVKVLKLKN